MDHPAGFEPAASGFGGQGTYVDGGRYHQRCLPLSLLWPRSVTYPSALEIVSPESQSRDRQLKFSEFEAAGVREYWIVDPISKVVEAYVLDAAQKYALAPETEGKICSTVVPGFFLKPEWLWMQPLPDVIAIARELGVTV